MVLPRSRAGREAEHRGNTPGAAGPPATCRICVPADRTASVSHPRPVDQPKGTVSEPQGLKQPVLVRRILRTTYVHHEPEGTQTCFQDEWLKFTSFKQMIKTRNKGIARDANPPSRAARGP